MRWKKTAEEKPEPGETVLICLVGRMTGNVTYQLAYLTKQGLWNLAGQGRQLYATPLYWCKITTPKELK